MMTEREKAILRLERLEAMLKEALEYCQTCRQTVEKMHDENYPPDSKRDP